MLLRFLSKLLVFIFLFTSCSTLKLSNREKIYSTTALGFTGGAVYGLSFEQAKGKKCSSFWFIIWFVFCPYKYRYF